MEVTTWVSEWWMGINSIRPGYARGRRVRLSHLMKNLQRPDAPAVRMLVSFLSLLHFFDFFLYLHCTCQSQTTRTHVWSAALPRRLYSFDSISLRPAWLSSRPCSGRLHSNVGEPLVYIIFAQVMSSLQNICKLDITVTGLHLAPAGSFITLTDSDCSPEAKTIVSGHVSLNVFV